MSGLPWTTQELEAIQKYTGDRSIQPLIPNRPWASIVQKAHRMGLGSIENRIRATKAAQTGVSKNKQYTHNDNAFNLPTVESAYWAGFIAADGCISRNRGSLVLQFGLQNKDAEAVYRLKDFLAHTGPVHKMNKSVNGIVMHGSRIYVFTCAGIASDLERIYNITPRKSLTLQPPNITDLELVKAFIVGYIDGDGCISQSNGYVSINTLGTKELLTWIKGYFDLWFSEKTNQQVIKINNIYSYTVTGKKAVGIVSLLKTATPYRLTRKWGP